MDSEMQQQSRYFSSFGLQRNPIIGDGNCLFRAISFSLYGHMPVNFGWVQGVYKLYEKRLLHRSHNISLSFLFCSENTRPALTCLPQVLYQVLIRIRFRLILEEAP